MPDLGNRDAFNALRGKYLTEYFSLADKRDALAAATNAGGGGNPFVWTHASLVDNFQVVDPDALIKLNTMQRRIDTLGRVVRALEAAQAAIDALAVEG